MYCKNCGTENPDKALFCKECGAKLNEEDTVEYATASNLSASSKKKNNGYNADFHVGVFWI